MNLNTRLVESLTNFFVGIVEVFLGLRFILRLFNANTASEFVTWLYGVTDQLLEPFRSIFPVRAVQPGFEIEFSTLFAMLVYAVIGMVVIWLSDLLTSNNNEPRDIT
ncbi:MAG: YggT family protein [Candidatus Saccharimonadales bacterium]